MNLKVSAKYSILIEKENNHLQKQLIPKYFMIFAIVYLIFGILPISLFSQPSGGPYGPIQKKYEIDKKANSIYFVSTDGNPNTKGLTKEKPTTLESAINKARTGDAIILRGGVYRTGNLLFNQGITLQPFEDEQPILKGTHIAKEWNDLRNGLWTIEWKHLFPSKPQDWWRRHREGKITPLHRFNNDMVFINGKFLQSAGWEGEVDEDSYYIDYENQTVYIGIDPTDKLVEITAYDAALIRTIESINGIESDKIGPTIKGITFTQYAYRAIEIEGKDPEGISNESNHGKDVVGTTLENCTITFCSRVAGYFRGDCLTIKNCLISDTSTEGLYILSSSDVLLEKNILRRNNIERITGYYPAAVKIFNQSYRVTCRDNLVIEHPYSNGIWYDVGNVDGVFVNNWIEGVGFTDTKINSDQVWPSQNGFFFEISRGVICAGNIFVNCDHGILVLNSSDAEIYNNTFVNSMAVIGRNERSAQGDHFGWHPSTGPDVDERIGHFFVNNLLTADEKFTRPLLFIWQSDALCNILVDQQFKEIDNNIYVRKSDFMSDKLILWSPSSVKGCKLSFGDPSELNKQYPNFERESRLVNNYFGYLFKGATIKNYQLLNKFSLANSGRNIPKNISSLINHSGGFVGAYKPIN